MASTVDSRRHDAPVLAPKPMLLVYGSCPGCGWWCACPEGGLWPACPKCGVDGEFVKPAPRDVEPARGFVAYLMLESDAVAEIGGPRFRVPSRTERLRASFSWRPWEWRRRYRGLVS